jgi:predicted enzyme related to lactoylglutathione lyase
MSQQTGVTGFGGVFLRAENPDVLYAWYEEQLGLKREKGSFLFSGSQQNAPTVLAFFSKSGTYWPQAQPAMINFKVEDLDAVLDRLSAAGVEVDPKRESYPYGRFGWFTDPEGNRVELWQPAEK